jgi:sulfofructose kinase
MATVLCVGIAALDQVFRVDAMPSRPEKYRSDALHVTGGGTAANAAVAAARLGAMVRFYGVLGDDRVGDEIVAGLVAECVDCGGIRRVAGRRSPLSAILVDRSGERLIVSYADPELPWSTDHLPDALPPGVDGVLGDTRWQTGSAHFFRLARAVGVPAVLDADRAPKEVPELMELATHVAFSHQAARDLTGEEDPSSALRSIGKPSSTWVAVTHGAEGVVHWRAREVARERAFAVRAVDTLGAGDTWHGAFAVALAEGASEEEALRFASAAAALKCTRFGGRDGAPRRGEVDQLLAGASGLHEG